MIVERKVRIIKQRKGKKGEFIIVILSVHLSIECVS